MPGSDLELGAEYRRDRLHLAVAGCIVSYLIAGILYAYERWEDSSRPREGQQQQPQTFRNKFSLPVCISAAGTVIGMFIVDPFYACLVVAVVLHHFRRS